MDAKDFEALHEAWLRQTVRAKLAENRIIELEHHLKQTNEVIAKYQAAEEAKTKK